MCIVDSFMANKAVDWATILDKSTDDRFIFCTFCSPFHHPVAPLEASGI